MMTRHPDERSTDELQQSIALTRAQLSETLGAIQAWLNPQRLMDAARDSVREGVQQAATEQTDRLVGRAREAALEARAALLDAIRKNPLASTLAGLGLGWVLNPGGQVRSGMQHAQDAAQQAAASSQEALQEQAGALGEQARALGEQAKQQMQKVEEWLRQATGGAPLALGALALAAGVVLGLSLPATEQERELLGEVREHLARQARKLTQDAGERAQRVAQEAQGAAVRAARDQGLIH
jgi:Protein of unknown function (DUF3618)